MDFREHQDRAKRNSRIIWVLYVLLLSISSLLIGWTFVVGLNLAELYQPGYEQYSFWQKFSASNSRAFNSEQIHCNDSVFMVFSSSKSINTLFWNKVQTWCWHACC
jgi:hypothetical protein